MRLRLLGVVALVAVLGGLVWWRAQPAPPESAALAQAPAPVMPALATAAPGSEAPAELPAPVSATVSPSSASASLAAPPALGSPRLPGEALVRMESREWRVQADGLGLFPRLYVEPAEEIAVSVELPAGEPGLPVIVQVMDGGRLLGTPEAHALSSILAEDRRVAFRFQADESPGTYRVFIQQGEERRAFDFWVGPENTPVASL